MSKTLVTKANPKTRAAVRPEPAAKKATKTAAATPKPCPDQGRRAGAQAGGDRGKAAGQGRQRQTGGGHAATGGRRPSPRSSRRRPSHAAPRKTGAAPPNTSRRCRPRCRRRPRDSPTASRRPAPDPPNEQPRTRHPRHAHKSDPKLANAWKSKAGRELTEAELLAMPEVEYMNDKQLEFFRAKLQSLKDDLLVNAGETTEHLREDTSIVPDPADRATIEEEHALELRTRDRERKLLKKISQSLARIDAGDYGFCDETGEPIGLGRLIARPTATLSLEAQQRRELKQKMFGD